MDKRILISLSVIAVVAVVAVGATVAYFSSTAKVDNNTFATGTLKILLKSSGSWSETLSGFTVNNAVPGDCKSGTFKVGNMGAPFFTGPSTLAAKELVMNVSKDSGDNGLWNALTIELKRCAGPCELVYDGPISSMGEKNLLMSWFSELPTGWSEDIQYKVCLPNTAGDQNALQGKSVVFDFNVAAYNPHR